MLYYVQMAYEIMEGSPGLRLDEVAHVLLPGRGRNQTGDGLSKIGEQRTDYAADFYIDQLLSEINGVIVPTGYKTPRDKAGVLWMPEDSNEQFRGIPEADCTKARLILRGIGASAIHVERHSIDTVTNFARSEAEGHFPDDRPTVIVAQGPQLERIIERIAPRTLRREFMGIVVPEVDEPDPDKAMLKLVSSAELLWYNPDTKNIVKKTTRNSNVVWGIVGALHLA